MADGHLQGKVNMLFIFFYPKFEVEHTQKKSFLQSLYPSLYRLNTFPINLSVKDPL